MVRCWSSSRLSGSFDSRTPRGCQTMLLGKFIALKFTGLRHWPLGAAYALVLIAIIVLLLVMYLRLGGSKNAFQASTNEGPAARVWGEPCGASGFSRLCCLVLVASSLTTPLRSPMTFTSPSLVMMSKPCGAMEPPILHPVPFLLVFIIFCVLCRVFQHRI